MNYFRITCYCQNNNTSYIFDSNGKFSSLKEFIKFFEKENMNVICASSEKNMIDVNCGKCEKDKNEIILISLNKGKPEFTTYAINGINYEAVKVLNKIYIPDKTKTI